MILYAISSAMLDLTRVFSSETADLLAREQKNLVPKLPQGPVVFPQKPWWRGPKASFNFDVLVSKTEMLQWLEWKEKDAVRKSKQYLCKSLNFKVLWSQHSESIWPKGVLPPGSRLSNSWNVLLLKYRTIAFACFSRRRNAVSEKPRWTSCFLKFSTECYKSAWSNSVFPWSATL